MRSLCLSLLSAVALLGVAAPAHAASAPVSCVHVFGLPCAADNVAAKPRALTLGGDGRTAMMHVRWRGWGRPTATGRGVWRSNDAGAQDPPHYIRHRGSRVVLSGLQRCGDVSVYTTMTLHVKGEPVMPDRLLYAACGD